MRVIIGYGNTLRGEDGFGVEVVRALREKKLHNTKLLEVFQLTPELVLELLDAEEILFIDAAYSPKDLYVFASPLQRGDGLDLSHHIAPTVIIESLKTLYNKEVRFEIFSLLCGNFEEIKNKESYIQRVESLADFLSKESSLA